MKKIILSAICLSISFAFAAPADSLNSEAQKLYGQRNFEAAAKTYARFCPSLEEKEKKICLLNEAKSLIEASRIDLAKEAEPKLLLLVSQTEPNDSLFSELSALDAKLQILLDQPVRAVRSWKAAQASASVEFFPQIYVLCQDIVSAYPNQGLTAENCNKTKPADTSLVSLPRKKIIPLAGTGVATQTQPKAQTPVHYTPALFSGKKWYVQLGAFSAKENAEKLVADFKNRGVQLYIVEIITDRKLFTVRTENFATRDEAESYAVQKVSAAHKDYKVLQ